MLIYNDGSLPENWTEADLFAPHTSKPYNPLIANAFFRSGQIEAWGRGIQKIAAARRYWGQPEPFYRIRSNEVMIGFDAEVGAVMNDGRGGVNGGIGADGGVIGTVNGANGGVNDAGFGVNGADGTVNVGIEIKNDGENGKSGGIEIKNGGNREDIVDLIANNSKITVSGISQRIGIPLRTVDRIVAELKNDGTIQRVGSKRYGHWVVKGRD